MLVQGYDSDSGSEHDSPKPTSLGLPPPKNGTAPKTKSSIGSILPHPKASGSGLSLPPPKQSSSTKRSKFQIKVDSLDIPEGDEEPQTKRPRPNMAKPTTLHGLFGMLPAPMRVEDIVKEEKEAQKAREGALKIVNAVQEEEEEAPKKGGKGNDDFRAMLGLKPKLVAQSSSTSTILPAALPSVASKESTPLPKPPVQEPPQPKPAPVNFFSLDSIEDEPAPSKKPSHSKPAMFSISSAPTIEDELSTAELVEEPTSYPGWQQDPDGTWVPITPEAHAQYAAWQASAEAQAAFDNPSHHHDGFNMAELARADIRSVDANKTATRPGIDVVDSKYAQAAAEIRAGLSGPVQSDKRGRLVSSHAKRRGQLSALLAQAEERGDELEEKWAEGREKRQQASARYGF